ncbi:MAG: tRNA preQ1(34) S-adenosylmethionine ribosyltransferase-isomerase QueA [Burkholderiaceae bacterium]|nr:tRNA preQ1(34) S-adenosylmethionine ribosyltransferase-isomerase QueA [Burkholderiaceae bacterium]
MNDDLTLSDFDFPLPPALIAQHPLPDRAASRLLHVADVLTDRVFSDITQLIAPGSVLVFNDTQVIKARLLGRKPSGGRVEALIERIVDARRALALVRTSHKPKEGSEFFFGGGDRMAVATVRGRDADFFDLEFDQDLLPLLERIGQVPLPPYITHAAEAEDAARYQTVYAKHPGAVAAPTAGLHFTDALLAQLDAQHVQRVHLTLHVGAGTFQPVRVEKVRDHVMHSEWYRIDEPAAAAINAARAAGRPVIAVGTTSLRALESAAVDGRVQAGSRDTALFITPGFRFQVVDRLITNFHLPKSTLLMLVSAFAGLDRIRNAYAHAVAQRYRFFSYGDAMLLERAR